MARKQKKVKLSDQIYQISTLVAGKFELQEVLTGWRGSGMVTNTTACSIRLLDDGSGDLTMRSTYGLSERIPSTKAPVNLDEPVIKKPFRQSRGTRRHAGRPRVRYREATIQEGLISR